jgi:hypothetical protein
MWCGVGRVAAVRTVHVLCVCICTRACVRNTLGASCVPARGRQCMLHNKHTQGACIGRVAASKGSSRRPRTQQRPGAMRACSRAPCSLQGKGECVKHPRLLARLRTRRRLLARRRSHDDGSSNAPSAAHARHYVAAAQHHPAVAARGMLTRPAGARKQPAASDAGHASAAHARAPARPCCGQRT